MSANNTSTTILCCNAVKITEHPDRPADSMSGDAGSDSDLQSPFEALHQQAGNEPRPCNPRVPFSSLHYHKGVIQVTEYHKGKRVAVRWYAEIRLKGKDSEGSGFFVEIPRERAEMEIGGILGDSEHFCTYAECPVHEGVRFVGKWLEFDEESYWGREVKMGEEEEDRNAGGEDEDEDMDDGEEEDEEEDDNQYAELRKRVSGGRGVPCDQCSFDDTSKSRKYCSRRMLPGGAECERCEENGWACTWDRF